MVASSRNRGFTIIEAMVVVAITGILVAIASTTWLRQREISRSRSCQENLSKIEGAKAQYAFEYRAAGTVEPLWSDLVGLTLYLKFTPECPGGGVYTIGILDVLPTCDYTAPTWLSDSRYAHRADP